MIFPGAPRGVGLVKSGKLEHPDQGQGTSILSVALVEKFTQGLTSCLGVGY